MTRDAADIGSGLAPARPPRPIGAGERIHVVGAAGAGASAAALLARYAGGAPSGCDPGGPSPYTPGLEELGITLAWEHSPGHVTAPPAPDRLAVTKALTSVQPDHPELVAARERGIALEPWQQVVADAALGRTLLGVAGTHGKSTSAGWLVHVLVRAGADPAAFVGALLPSSLTGGAPATARWGRGAAFVVEADEYAANFEPFRPAVALVTNAEWDHPDVFADRAAVIAALDAWLRRAVAAAEARGQRASLVINVGDPGAAVLVGRLLELPVAVVAVALVDGDAGPMAGRTRAMAEQLATAAGPAEVLLGRVAAEDVSGTLLEIHGPDPRSGPVSARLATAGRHNAANALCVAGAAHRLGLSAASIARGLGGFSGVGRRLERKGEVGGVLVYDDYGHHPSAIRATLAAVRQREPGRRVWAVHEPLTYHRTAALLEGLAAALAEADAVAVADIWPGRDPDTTIASADGLARAVAARRPDIPVAAPGTVEATARWLAGEVRSGDVILVMGGGRSYRIGELLLEALARR